MRSVATGTKPAAPPRNRRCTVPEATIRSRRIPVVLLDLVEIVKRIDDQVPVGQRLEKGNSRVRPQRSTSCLLCAIGTRAGPLEVPSAACGRNQSRSFI